MTREKTISTRIENTYICLVPFVSTPQFLTPAVALLRNYWLWNMNYIYLRVAAISVVSWVMSISDVSGAQHDRRDARTN